MQTASIPDNESDRLESLKKLQLLDTPTEERFNRITKLATRVFNIPISTISLVDTNREWYKSVCGLDEKEGDRAISFCGHAMLEDEILIIPDATKDSRFFDNPMVVGEPFIRFYAGVALFSADGARIGTFCVKGHEPREITEEEKDILKGLAKWTELEINSHNLSVALDQVKKSVTEMNNFFQISQDIMGIANTDGFWKRFNPAFKKILGYSGEELLKSPFLNFIHPEDIEATRNEVAKLASGVKTINFLNRYRKSDGSYVVIQWNATPFGDNIYATGRDVSEKKEHETQSDIQQKRLEQLTSRFSFATKSAKIGIWEWDVINNRLVWDNQMYVLYGIKPEQFGGAYEAWQAGLHPDDKKAGDYAIQQALAGEKEFDITFRVIWPNTSIHFIKAYGSVEKDAEGVPRRMVGVNWDVTEDKSAELKLKQFEAVIRDTDDAVISKTIQGIVTGWNNGAQKIYGYTPEEIIGKSIRMIIPPDHDDLDNLLRKISTGERIPSYTTVRKRKDGSLVNVSLTISPIYSDNKSIIGASIVARDITKETMIQAQILKEREQFRNYYVRAEIAIRSAKIGIWEWDVVKNLLTWDDQMYKLYGIRKEDFGGAYDAWQQGLHPEDKQLGDEAIQSALAGEKDFNTQFRVLWPNGEIRYIQAHAIVERDSVGKPLSMIGVNFDITHEKEVDHAKSEFVSLASHQLRTPLSAINWNTEILLAGDAGPLSEQQKKYVTEVAHGNKRMVDLVNALLNTARLELGTFIVEPKPVHMVELVHSVLGELQPDIKKKRQKITKKIDKTIVKFLADEKLFRIVMQNLLSNAVKYTQEDGSITVTLSVLQSGVTIDDRKVSEDSLLFSVADSGMGIPISQQSKIFSKLFRADNAKKSESEGTGLGLYIIKSIIEQSGGIVWFTSLEKKLDFLCNISDKRYEGKKRNKVS